MTFGKITRCLQVETDLAEQKRARVEWSSNAVFSLKSHRHHSRLYWSYCLGLLLAFLIVASWLPKTWSMWNLPIQAIDAPSHYYFIRKLMQNGLSVVWELNPNDSFYPPLFHVLVYVLLSVSSWLGIQVNIFTGLNLIWLVTSGLLFPMGMLLWLSLIFIQMHQRDVRSSLILQFRCYPWYRWHSPIGCWTPDLLLLMGLQHRYCLVWCILVLD